MSLRSVLLTASAVACTLCSDREAAAGLMYSTVDQTGFGTGWEFIGGQLTTDGSLGSVDDTDFIDWDVQFSSPVGTYRLTPANSRISVFWNSPADQPIANSDSLFFEPGQDPAIFAIRTLFPDADEQQVIFSNSTATSAATLRLIDDNAGGDSSIVIAAAGSQAVIANAVPEPSSAVFFGLLLLAASGSRRSKA